MTCYTDSTLMAHSSHQRAAFIGVGRMATALIGAFAERGIYASSLITGTHHDPHRARELSSILGVEVIASNIQAVTDCRTIYLCVRPDQIPNVTSEISRAIQRHHSLISLAVGVPISWLRRALPKCGSIFHVHPSSLAMAHVSGVSYIACEETGSRSHLEEVEEAFASIGETSVVPEPWIDKYAVFAGCCPAFFSFIASSWLALAEQYGLPCEDAHMILARILQGLGDAMSKGEPSLGEIQSRIATPGGVTETGLNVLSASGICVSLQSMVDHCLAKIEELRASFSTDL